MKLLRTDAAVVGKRVLSADTEPDASDVLSQDLRARNHVLMPQHPGVIDQFDGPGLNHCIVQFLGLEHEPISMIVGYDHDSDGVYVGLIDPTDDEWHTAVANGWWTSPPEPEV